MAKRHVMTSARRAALRKAQLASARKRRGHGHGKLAAANRRFDSFKRTTRNTLIAAAAVGGAAALSTKLASDYRKRQFKQGSIKIRELPGKHYTHRGGKTRKVARQLRFKF